MIRHVLCRVGAEPVLAVPVVAPVPLLLLVAIVLAVAAPSTAQPLHPARATLSVQLLDANGDAVPFEEGSQIVAVGSAWRGMAGETPLAEPDFYAHAGRADLAREVVSQRRVRTASRWGGLVLTAGGAALLLHMFEQGRGTLPPSATGAAAMIGGGAYLIEKGFRRLPARLSFEEARDLAAVYNASLPDR